MNYFKRTSSGLVRRPRLLIWISGLTTVTLVVAVIAWYFVWPNMLLEFAQQALDQGNPLAAQDYLNRRGPPDLNDERAMLLSAEVARQTDDCVAAEGYIEKLESVRRPTAASRLEWAMLGAQQGDVSDDEDMLRSEVKRGSADSKEILEALAKGYIVSYRFKEALEILDYLIGRNNNYIPTLLLRGDLLQRLRRMEPAEKDLRRAIEVMPESSAAQAALGGFLQRSGFAGEAILHFETARRSKPADPVILLGLARAYIDQAELDEADRCLEALLAASPEHVDGLIEKGRLAIRRNKLSDAEKVLERAVRKEPNQVDAESLYLLVLKELGKDEAASVCQRRVSELRTEYAVGGRLKLLARDKPLDAAVRWDLWLWSKKNDQRAEGFAWLTEVLRIDPQHTRAHAALAEYYEQAGQLRRAAQHRAEAGNAVSSKQ